MSNVNVVRKNLGPVTAYKYAVQQGYTGTEQEFAALMASYATVAEEAEAAKDDAIDAKTAAEAAQAAAEAAAEQAEGAIDVDDTLSVEGSAADAKETGRRIESLSATNPAITAFEQGSVKNTANKTYEQSKDSSSTRIRLENLLAVDSTKTYSFYSDSGLDICVYVFNVNKKNTGDMTGWLNAMATVSGANYVAIALKKKDQSNILPSESGSVRIIEHGLLSSLNTIKANVRGNSANISAIASNSEYKPNIISGVYSWNTVAENLKYQSNDARATADLRMLELTQGDLIGITDYSTYSIAFGDNRDSSHWYSGGFSSGDITANDSNILPYVLLVKRNDNQNMTEEDFAAIKEQFHSTSSVKNINFTKSAIRNIKENLNTRANRNYVHLSFDDVGNCILNLANNSFDSLWDEPFFNMLKTFHDTYGAVFSLYVWDVANLANIPTTYKQEFINSSDWLKFGFHATAQGSLANATAQEAKAGYDTFITNIFAKCGGVNSVDRIPRLNYFAGNVNALKALRDCDCGCIGFLNTDDTRSAYYLTQEELTYLRTHSLWSDRTNGLQFVSTCMRLDWFVDGFTSSYQYNVPVEDNPYDELVHRYAQPAMSDLYSTLIVFTHEWQTYSSAYILNTDMVDRIEQVCRFANDYNYDFDFPQNRVESITSYAIQ